MPTTLREIRQIVGAKTGDVLVLEATHDSSEIVASPLTNLRDVARLVNREDRAKSIVNRLGYFNGHNVLGYTASSFPNMGLSVAVTDFRSPEKIITFEPQANVAPTVGDEFELWTVTERIGSIAALHILIRYAISLVADVSSIETNATPETFNIRSGVVDIPEEWRGGTIGGASYTTREGYIKEIEPYLLEFLPAHRKLKIKGIAAAIANGRPVMVYGYPKEAPLMRDVDSTSIELGWIVESVSGALTLAPSWRSSDPAAAERRASYWGGQAALYRRDVVTAHRGLGLRIP